MGSPETPDKVGPWVTSGLWSYRLALTGGHTNRSTICQEKPDHRGWIWYSWWVWGTEDDQASHKGRAPDLARAQATVDQVLRELGLLPAPLDPVEAMDAWDALCGELT